MKNFNMRVSKKLDEQFAQACDATGTTKTDAVTNFMLDYVNKHQGGGVMPILEYTDNGLLIVDELIFDPGLPRHSVVRIKDNYYMIGHEHGGPDKMIPPEAVRPNFKTYAPTDAVPFNHDYIIRGLMPRGGFVVKVGRSITKEELETLKDAYSIKEQSQPFKAVIGGIYGKAYQKSFIAINLVVAEASNISLADELQAKGIEASAIAPGVVRIKVGELTFKEMVENATNEIEGNDYTELMNQARQMADNGLFTDDEDEFDESEQYLVADMADVVQAHFNDLAVMKVFDLTIEDIHKVDGAEKWAEKHGIEILG